MQAVIFAAGVGERLGKDSHHLPKVLLKFGGKTLLERHLNNLQALGISQVTVGAGFAAKEIQEELYRLNAHHVDVVENPDYREGSIITLWALRHVFLKADKTLFMDGDVLYDRKILQQLIISKNSNNFLIDRELEDGDEPMKLGIRDGYPVDFRKVLEKPCDFYGESVGFFCFNHDVVQDILKAANSIILAGRRHDYMEEAIRQVLLVSPQGTFNFIDISGLPWIEIDFPNDIIRANDEILPKLV